MRSHDIVEDHALYADSGALTVHPLVVENRAYDHIAARVTAMTSWATDGPDGSGVCLRHPELGGEGGLVEPVGTSRAQIHCDHRHSRARIQSVALSYAWNKGNDVQ
jgi:hypothetical protein